MAVLVIGQVKGGDAALDARMMQELGLQDAPAPGASQAVTLNCSESSAS